MNDLMPTLLAKLMGLLKIFILYTTYKAQTDEPVAE